MKLKASEKRLKTRRRGMAWPASRLLLSAARFNDTPCLLCSKQPGVDSLVAFQREYSGSQSIFSPPWLISGHAASDGPPLVHFVPGELSLARRDEASGDGSSPDMFQKMLPVTRSLARLNFMIKMFLRSLVNIYCIYAKDVNKKLRL